MGALLAVVPWVYRWMALAALVAAFAGFFWLRGDMHGTQKLLDYQAKEATQAVAVITLRGAATERVVERYVKVQGATKVITETIEKEVFVYANTGNCLDPAWGLLHDDAALHRVPNPGLGFNAAAGAPTASAALQTVTSNYGACWRTADRLTALQEWVKTQQAVR